MIDALGADHLDVANTCANLAEIYIKEGNYLKAEDAFKRALEIRRDKSDTNHPDIADIFLGLARVYKVQSNDELDCTLSKPYLIFI